MSKSKVRVYYTKELSGGGDYGEKIAIKKTDTKEDEYLAYRTCESPNYTLLYQLDISKDSSVGIITLVDGSKSIHATAQN